MDPRTTNLPLPTERLLVREFRPDDWHDLHAYASDPLVVVHMQWGPNNEAQSRVFMDRRRPAMEAVPRQQWELGIELKSENRLIGGCGLRITSEQHRQAELGYVLNRAYWGQGLMTEATHALVDFGFRVLKLHRISATTDPDNLGSARVLQKLGMQREGLLREDKWIRMRWCDRVLYAILASEWPLRVS